MNRFRISKPSLMIAVAAVTVGLVGTTTAVAGQEASAPAPLNHDQVVRAQNLAVQTQDGNSTVNSTTFALFTSDTVRIPATGNYRVLARFSGESDCQAASWCTARIIVDGVEAFPQSGDDFAFDSPGGNLWESNSFERISHLIRGTGAARSVSVTVETAVVDGGSWNLDDWTVVAQVFKA